MTKKRRCAAFLCLSAALLLGAAPLRAASLSEADRLFDKGLYQDALKKYDEVLRGSSGSEKWKALYRACESEALLFRYGEALGRIRKAKLPKDPLWRARFLFLDAELGREFLKQYGYRSRTDVVEDDQKDVFRRTPKELHQDVSSAYWGLWALRKKLAKRLVAQERYFVDVAEADRTVYPTYLDFLVLRWTQYLLYEAPEPKGMDRPKAESFLGQRHRAKPDPKASLAEIAGEVMEYAYQSKDRQRSRARELWRIERLMLPFRNGGKVRSFQDREQASKTAAAVLAKWKDEFDTAGGKAAAGYAAAELYNGLTRFDDAVELCVEVEKKWPKTLGGRKCRRLTAQIKTPQLSLESRVTPPSGKGALTVSTRNLEKVYVRLYKTSPEDLRSVRKEVRWRRYKNRARDNWTWSGILNRVDQDHIKEFLSSRRPAKSFTTAMDIKSIYELHSQKIDVKAEPGVYVAVVSSDDDFTPGESMISGAVLNITRLVLVGTTGLEGCDRELIYDPERRRRGIGDEDRSRSLNAFHLYLLDGVTGRAVPHNKIAVRYGRYGNWEDGALTTDRYGRARKTMDISLRLGDSSSQSMDPLAEKDGSWAFWANPASAGFSVPSPYRLFIETDRPIYRPGQKVGFKATVVQRTPRGFKTYAGDQKVHIMARDANYQEFFKTELRADSMGTASGSFLIPTGRLLGNYHLEAWISEEGRHYSASTGLAVEEYKRPEFEVKLKEAEGAWRFGKDAEVKGTVKYYFGGPVPDAPVSYKVYRQTWIPWFCWWWSWRSTNSSREEVLNATTKTDADGDFSFHFTPEARDRFAEDPMPARFTVEVEARDPGGRTIKDSKSYTAGKKAYLFHIDPSAGFARKGRSFPVETKLVNLNEQPVSGKGSFALYRLDDDPGPAPNQPSWGGAFPRSPSLDQLYKDVKNGPKVQGGAVSFTKKGAALKLDPMKPGAYRLSLSAKDPWGGEVEQSVILLSVDPKAKTVPLKISGLALPEHPEYAAGETALMLLGSSEITGLTHIEVWGGRFLHSRRVRGGGVRLFRLPLTDKQKGGVTVRWFGIKDFKPRAGVLTLKVPWKEKELRVRLKYDKVLRPGQKASWSLSVKDRKGRGVTGEASARMYDRSLEYYAKSSEVRLDSLYSARPRPQYAQGSVQQLYASQIRVEKGWIMKLLEAFRTAVQEPHPPSLRLNRSRVYGGYGMLGMASGGGGAMRKGMLMETADFEMAADGFAAQGARPASLMMAKKSRSRAPGMAAPREEKAAAQSAVKARKDFSETAFYKPQLRVKNGRSTFSFKAPEQLTSWRVGGNVHTSDMKVGKFSEEAVTRKELMVRVEMPRFFREGDKGTLKAVVHNESEAAMTGSLTLQVLEEGRPAASRLKLSGLEKTFTVKPHGLQAFAWPVSVPAGITTFQVRTIARSGKKVDAEEREIPILPSRQRLIDSKVVALNGNVSKTITLKPFEVGDPSRQSELLQLQVDPQLALTVLNSLPFLMRYPYECVEQTLNRYVPAAIVNEIYKRHPAIAKAAAKIPKRKTLTPAWDRSDPKRLMSLMETPWLQQSEGREAHHPIIDLFDAKVVELQKKDALSKLKNAQLPSGGFPWFPGGREDPYITLYVLAGFAEAQHYGVGVPEDVIRRALQYVMNEIPRQRRLKPEQRNVALILYASYVVTSFPDLTSRRIPELRQARKIAKAWLAYADKHSDAMTKLGKAYAAYAYWRLGDRAKGNLYLKRAMDGAREDPVAGVYWQPEKYSWLWYNDTLETHAFMIRMLQTVRPKDERLPGLIQWLLFNRKGTEWKSTKASAAAIFALLDYMNQRGALDKGDTYTVRWGKTTDVKQIEPDDWLAKPMRWTLRGSDVTPAYYRPKVEKKGPGLAFASLTYIYTTEELAEESEPGMMNVQRKFYRRVKQGEDYHLKPLKRGDTVKVGDEIEVQLKINTRSQFEYVHLKDPRGAGFEAEALRSGWKWDQLGRYEEPRDSLTNFFVSWLPHGEYILRYRVRPTTPGRYRIGAAVMQSMYAPEFAAHSAGFELKVVEE